jgi:hypothetical protein
LHHSTQSKEIGDAVTEVVSIDYQLGKNGWSNFQLSVGTASVVVGPFGYCTDALGDLVRSTDNRHFRASRRSFL